MFVKEAQNTTARSQQKRASDREGLVCDVGLELPLLGHVPKMSCGSLRSTFSYLTFQAGACSAIKDSDPFIDSSHFPTSIQHVYSFVLQERTRSQPDGRMAEIGRPC